ncbi:MAG: DUF2169 domain-containing protein [Myxococcota bacterium]
MSVHLVALNPCAGITLLWRFQRRLHLTVVVKATFSLPPTGTMALVNPLPVYERDQTLRNLPTTSVVGPSDRAPMKRRADVTLSGRAYAGFGSEVTTTQVRMSMLRGHRLLLNKTLIVRGDQGGEVPFATMDLGYERAFGGVGFEPNPIGTGVGDGEAPNIVYPTRPEVPAGYAPIPEIWPVRKKRIGGMKRKDLQASLVELPEDFDWTYFQGAPDDQQVGYLEGDECIELDGLHPDAMKASVALPGARAVGALFGPGATKRRLLGFVADSLHLQPDERRCTMTWRSVFELEASDTVDALLVAVGVACEGAPVDVPRLRPRATAGGGRKPRRKPPFGPQGTENVAGTAAPTASDPSPAATLEVPSVGGAVPPSSRLGAPFALARGRSAARPAPEGAPWAEAAPRQPKPLEPNQRHTIALPSESREAIASMRATAPPSPEVPPPVEASAAAPSDTVPARPKAEAATAPPVATMPAAASTAPRERPASPHVRGGHLDPERERAAAALARARTDPRIDVREALYREFS